MVCLPLHYLYQVYVCVSVQRLVDQGIPLEAENKEKEAACDCAEKNGHSDIAIFLESKMVFSAVCSLPHVLPSRMAI